MPFNGTGMFVRLRNWVEDATAGVKIRADYHDIEDDNFAGGISQCIARDGQSTVTNNIPMNGKRMVALADPVDPQDASSKAYADTKLPLAGGTINGSLTVTGTIDTGLASSAGHRTRTGLQGPYGGNYFNFNWTGNLEAWVDNSNIGTLATTAYVENRAQAWAAAYADPKVNRAGDTITGGLTVNGELVAAATYLRFNYSGSPGYISWQGGGSYLLGGGGTIWHDGNLRPISDGRLSYVGTGAGGEPYAGCVVTGFTIVSTGPLTGAVNGGHFRQLQLQTPGGWYTVAYV